MARYKLSATEVSELTGWPDAMVSEWLEAIDEIDGLIADATSIRGVVSSAGVGTGDGFTSAKTATGSYSVTFSVEKDDPDYIVLPSASSQNHICSYDSKTTTGFNVKITSSGALSDSEFNFMVKE